MLTGGIIQESNVRKNTSINVCTIFVIVIPVCERQTTDFGCVDLSFIARNKHEFHRVRILCPSICVTVMLVGLMFPLMSPDMLKLLIQS